MNSSLSDHIVSKHPNLFKQRVNRWMCKRLKKLKLQLKLKKITVPPGRKNYGPRIGAKQKQPPAAWSSGIIPPPFVVSIASSNLTTSSISGLFSGLASQQCFIIVATELGQHRGISGLKFCKFRPQLHVAKFKTIKPEPKPNIFFFFFWLNEHEFLDLRSLVRVNTICF